MLNSQLNKIIFTITFFLYSGFYALLAFAITIVGSNGSRFVTVPLRLLTSVLMISVLIGSLMKNRKTNRQNNIYIFLFLFFWGVYFLKVLLHHNNTFPLRLFWAEYIFYAINFTILPFLVFANISFQKFKRTILNALISSGFAMGLICLFLYREVLASGIARISLYIYKNPELETLNPLALSYASVLTIVLCLYEFLYNKKKSKVYIGYLCVTIALSLIMFLLGASRGSLLAFAGSVIYLVFMSDAKVKMKAIILLLVFIPIVIWSVAVSGSGIIDRTTSSVDSGTTGREFLWLDAWNEFLVNPIIGGRIEIGFYPHNIILEIIMSMGLVGLSIFLFLLVKGVRNSFLLPKSDKNYLWVGVIFIQGFIQFLFSGSLYSATLVFFPLCLLMMEEDKTNTFLTARNY